MSNIKIIKFTCSKKYLQSMRLDKIIVIHINTISRSMIKKLILSGHVSINNIIIRIPKKKFFLMTTFAFVLKKKALLLN